MISSKPDNILFIQKRAVLADIGLTDNLETTGDIGTPQFMPKKALKSYNQGDLYALGMVMYCALTGNNPNKFPKIPKDLPQECRSLIAICGKACNQEFNITQFKTALESTTAKKTNLKLIAGAVIGLMAMVIVGVSLHKPKETKVETKAEVVTPKTSETPQPVYQYEPPKTWDTPTIDIDEDNPIFTSLLVDKLYVNSDLPANKVRVYNKMYTLSSTPSISESSTIPTMGGGYTIKDSYEQVVIDYPCDKYTVSAGIYSGKPLGCSEKLPTIPKLEKYISYSFKCSNTLSMAEFKYFLDVLEQYYPPIPLEVARAAEKHYLEQWASYVENINIIEGNKERRKLVAKAVVWDDEARAKLAKTKEFKNYFRQEIELKDPLYALGELIVDIPEAIRLERSRLFTIENHMYRLNCAYKNYLEWKKTEKN